MVARPQSHLKPATPPLARHFIAAIIRARRQQAVCTRAQQSASPALQRNFILPPMSPHLKRTSTFGHDLTACASAGGAPGKRPEVPPKKSGKTCNLPQ